MRTLTIGGFLCALLALAFLPLVFSLLALTLALAVVAKGKVEHGAAVILVAGVCGYYSLHAWKPLDTFHEVNPIETMLVAPAPQLPPGSPNDWHLLSVEARTVGQPDGDPVCEWKLVVRNESFQPQTYHGSLQFQDPKGAVVTEGRVESYKVPAGTVAVITGSLPLKSGMRVARVVPQISVGG